MSDLQEVVSGRQPHLNRDGDLEHLPGDKVRDDDSARFVRDAKQFDAVPVPDDDPRREDRGLSVCATTRCVIL